MKLIYGQKYSVEERKEYIPHVHINILSGIKTLCEQVEVYNLFDNLPSSIKSYIDLINSLNASDEMTTTIAEAIKAIWSTSIMITIWNKRSEFQIIDSVKYYLDKIDEIKKSDYIPTENDILQCRVRTSGAVIERYIIDKAVFEMYDVGGQRNERKKWIHCFDGVTAIIFVAALSEYDQNLFEDGETNRMIEAIDLFNYVCNNEYFKNSSMILFLNKKDLFFDKIKIKNIKDYEIFTQGEGIDGTGRFFPYDGPDHDYDAGITYFLNEFLRRNITPERPIYHHVTCATDTHNVKVVFNACKDIILRENLKHNGFT